MSRAAKSIFMLPPAGYKWVLAKEGNENVPPLQPAAEQHSRRESSNDPEHWRFIAGSTEVQLTADAAKVSHWHITSSLTSMQYQTSKCCKLPVGNEKRTVDCNCSKIQ